MNKFKIGQRYKVINSLPKAENVIEIIRIKDKEIYYKTVLGCEPIFSSFCIDSLMSKYLKLISESEKNEEP